MRSFATRLLVVLTLSLAACAESPQKQADRWNKQRPHVTEALEKKTDPDSLAAAGVLSFENPETSLGLLSRAVAAAPERPDLLWLQARACEKWPACDPDPLDRRLRTLDAENGAPLLSALARAEALHDVAAKDTALAAIAHSRRVDIYWTTLIARLSSAIAQTGAIPLRDAEVSIIGVLAAQAIPALQNVSAGCRGDRLDHPDVLEVCRGLAQACENGDTYIMEMLGVAIAKRVWPEQSSAWTAAAEARRVYEYRVKLSKAFDSKPLDDGTARNLLALYTENRREQDVLRARLVAAGENPDPPPLN